MSVCPQIEPVEWLCQVLWMNPVWKAILLQIQIDMGKDFFTVNPITKKNDVSFQVRSL